MTKKHHQSPGPGKTPPEKPSKQGEEKESEDACRCKVVAKKSPSELLRLMISDLSFRKKGEGQK